MSVMVLFAHGGDAYTHLVGYHDTLRHVQSALCKAFHQRWPFMKAEIWRRDAPETLFDEFADKPFIECVDASVFEVRFVHTDDPFFYDMNDRTGVKPPTLEEEIAFDDAGDAGRSLNEWLLTERHANELPLVVDFPDFL